MNLLDLGKLLFNIVKATPAGAAYSAVRQSIPQLNLPDPSQFISNQLNNFSYKPAQLDLPNQIASLFGGGSEAYKTVEQQPVYPFRNMPSPQQFVQQSAKTLLENVMPAFIGTVPLPPVTGWSLPRAIGTTTGFAGLQKLAGYKNEEILNPVNLGLTFAGGGLKFGNEPVTLKNISEKIEPQRNLGRANEQLRFLLKPEQVAENLRARGFNQYEVRKMTFPEYWNIMQKNISPSQYRGTQRASVPNTLEGTAFSRLFSEWIGKRQSSLTTALERSKEFKKIPQELTWDIVKELETPNYKSPPEIRNYARIIRNEYNKLYADASKSGIDVSYLRNYITHIWDQNPQEVAQIFKSVRGKFKFAKDRILPTYEEGMQLGLKPRYQSIVQIMTEYIRKLNETKANIEFIRKLKDEGLVVIPQKGGQDPSFSPITAQGFPQAKTVIRGNTVFSPYYAKTEIANLINRVFSEQKSELSGLAKASGGVQDVVMSGGIPKTPANAWSFAQLTKEFAAGRIVDPIKAFFRSFSGKASNEFFAKNTGQIKKMQDRNIPISTTYNTENMVSKGVIRDTFGDNFATAWNKTVNEPTFKRFMPQLQIELFNSIEKKALQKGLSETKAGDIAATAVKKFYGVKGSDKLALESSFSKDVKGAFFFAPRYRESMINFWMESVKALKDPLALENQTNVRFLIGTVLTYFVMNEINKKTYGKPMSENPPGTEDKLLIPLGNGDVIGIPLLSSIATMPRLAYRMGRRAIEGDIPGVAKEARGTLSSLVRPVADVLANEDYFQRQIVEEGQKPQEKLKSIGQYLLSQYLAHPYLRELFDKRNSKDPAYQRLSRAMEAPFRFYTEKALQGKVYYSARDEALSGLNAQEKAAYDAIPKYDANNYDPNSTILKYQIYLTYPEVFRAKQQTELEMFAKTGKPIDPLYLVDFETAKKYMRYETLPPGSQDRKMMTQAYPELVALFNVRGKYFNQNPMSGQNNRPIASDTVQAAMDRKDWNYPGVKEYLNANRAYQNQQRQLLGLPAITEYSSYGGYTRKPSKITKRKIRIAKLPKVKLAKIRSKKLKMLKIKKAPKIKLLKIKNIYQALRPNFI
jgi:hypothetical protein